MRRQTQSQIGIHNLWIISSGQNKGGTGIRSNLFVKSTPRLHQIQDEGQSERGREREREGRLASHHSGTCGSFKWPFSHQTAFVLRHFQRTWLALVTYRGAAFALCSELELLRKPGGLSRCCSLRGWGVGTPVFGLGRVGNASLADCLVWGVGGCFALAEGCCGARLPACLLLLGCQKICTVELFCICS